MRMNRKGDFTFSKLLGILIVLILLIWMIVWYTNLGGGIMEMVNRFFK